MAEDAISAARETFADALDQGDAAAAAAVYADDARLLAPSAELLEGRDAICAFWRAGLDAGVSHAEFDPLQLERVDGLAYEIGRYALHVEPPDGAALVDRGKYLLVHARQSDGTWRRVVEMFSPDSSQEER